MTPFACGWRKEEKEGVSGPRIFFVLNNQGEMERQNKLSWTSFYSKDWKEKRQP